MEEIGRGGVQEKKRGKKALLSSLTFSDGTLGKGNVVMGKVKAAMVKVNSVLLERSRLDRVKRPLLDLEVRRNLRRF